MNKQYMRIFTMALLMMVSMGAWADQTIRVEKSANGSVAVSVSTGLTLTTTKTTDEYTDYSLSGVPEGKHATVTLTTTPAVGYYTLLPVVQKTYSIPSPSPTRSPGISTITVSSPDANTYTFEMPDADYGVKITVEFANAAYRYFTLHKDGKGYMRQWKGIVNNDGTFHYENAYDGNGSSIWVYSNDGYLQNEMYYLNVINGKTLYLSPTPVTKWNLVDDGDKKRFQMNGSTKILGLNSSNAVVLEETPAFDYAACTLTVTENNSKWDGPKDLDVTVQSPQLLTYLRTYYIRNITVTIDKNDKGESNVILVNNKDSRCYCMRIYDTTQTAPSGMGTNWDYDDATKVIYNKTTSNQAVTATYSVAPVDPITRVTHPATDQSCKVTITPKALAPNSSMKYLLFNTQDDNYRIPYANTSLSEGDFLPVNGKASNLTEAINEDLSWDIEVDDEGYYSFKNVATSRYLYYDAADYTVSDYGAVKIGATTPSSDDTRYKFRLFSGGVKRDPFSGCYYIIPYDKQFAVYKSDATIEEVFFALYMNTSGATKIAGLTKASDPAKWKLYTYEWQYRLWSNYTINGEKDVYTSGDHVYTATTWFSRNIKDSPQNTDYCTLPGSKTKTGITYTWELTGLDDYVTTPDDVESDGISKLTAKVTLPAGTRSGTLKVTAKITSPANISNNTSIPITLYNLNPEFTPIANLSAITDPNGLYQFTANTDLSYRSDNKPAITTFKGTLDGGNQTITGLTAPLFETIDGGTVRNLNLDNITISSGNEAGNVGAICCEAKGITRIYNCGILATNSTVTTDNDGYTHIETNSSTVSGTNYVGGLVGLLDGEARVINCFSYADITGGSEVGGIVGHNNYLSTTDNIRTMVMNCMFYGDITGSTSKAPIYNGGIISNLNSKGLGNYNYFRAEASYVQDRDIQVYHCALMAETRYLQRFEFFRHFLNSNRALAAWYATGSVENKDQMMKWVMDPSQIGSSTPYPILNTPGYYPSIVNIDAENAVFGAERNKGGTLSEMGRNGELKITIQMGDGEVYTHPANAVIRPEIVSNGLTLNITDKDFDHFNFNYGKVQLPYYNDVGTGNYTDERVVTGWKIVSIDGGTAGTLVTTGSDAEVGADGSVTMPFNYADPQCTAKDKYSSTNKRVFNQGAYWDVPEGVTEITIQPYWGNAKFAADEYYDVVYNNGTTAQAGTANTPGGKRFVNGKINIEGNDYTVYTKISDAKGQLGLNANHTVYDHAVVLVGNVHASSVSSNSASEPYTIMSADLDGDNEPDNTYVLTFSGRTQIHPIKVDFLNVPGLGMVQKSTTAKGTYNFGIPVPLSWFEVSNTALFRVTQFEYDRSNRGEYPIILHGGVIEQWVSGQNDGISNKTTYFHIGGNVWFKEFHIGIHQDKDIASKHPPISITGGDYEKFYLTGAYRSDAKIFDDNAECYVNGGRFGTMAGTGMEGLGSSPNKGNIFWQINNADIDEFFGGGINAKRPAVGNIHTIIRNSHVGLFCGGPKFGDMKDKTATTNAKTVTTDATNCTFDTFFGAGYGGNSYNRYAPKNFTGTEGDFGQWNKWVKGEVVAPQNTYYSGYKQDYYEANGGVSVQIDYQYLPESGNVKHVERLFIDYVSFSLATTHNVTSTLNGCTINGNFYGGGSLGKVDGPVTSTLKDCMVLGSVFGAGFSATTPTVEVMNTGGFKKEPFFDENLGAYLPAEFPDAVTYHWAHAGTVNSTETAINKTGHILYTTENLTTLGTVTGKATLNINDGTTVAGSVYGGGEMSAAAGDIEVNINGGNIGESVFGGGKEGDVGGSVVVNVNGGTVVQDVYGGGALANTNTNNTTATNVNTTAVNLHNGTIQRDVYGGGLGSLAQVEPAVTAVEALVKGDVLVTLNGKEVVDNGVKTYPDECVVKGRVFGCNNLNGTPKGDVTVHVYKTSGGEITPSDKLDDIIESNHKYQLSAVYGGGNLAAYVPDDPNNRHTHVIIDGCSQTSINTVYGGGNAASTPATQVDVNGTYEIAEVFGGGNGKDDISRDGGVTWISNPGANVGYKNYSTYDAEGNKWNDNEDADTKAERLVSSYIYGSGSANVKIVGGRIHRVFGGSNTKGNVRITAVTMLDDLGGCPFDVDEAYGGGKSAPMDGEAKLLMSCIPGLDVAYGGAEEANVLGDVTLNITNGNFDRVFGGNNISGTIGGKITVNIEETGCRPIIIGQLYGGGNQASYDANGQTGPTVNIKSFTSIGEVYGGGYGISATVKGDTHVFIDEVMGRYADGTYLYDTDDPASGVNTKTGDREIKFSEFVRNENGDFLDDEGNVAASEEDRAVVEQTIHVNIPTFTANKIGVIGTVYGGGNQAKVVGDTHVNIGTKATIDFETGIDGAAARKDVVPEGANIQGNVYGGGNQAEVTGSTNVIIGQEATP